MENGRGPSPEHDLPDEEAIDLVELSRLCWRNKVLIIIFTALGILSALLYASMGAERWSSVAHVEPPRVKQFAAYLEQRRILAQIAGRGSAQAASPVDLFGDFIELSAAERVRREFFLGTAYYKNLVQGVDTATAGDILARLLNQDLQLIAPGQSDISTHHVLSFTADNPVDAQRVLAAFIKTVDKQALERAGQVLGRGLESGIVAHRQEMAALEQRVQAAPESQGAGSLVEGRPAHVLPPYYFELRHELQVLESMRESQAAPLAAYGYRLAPTLPLHPAQAGRMLLIALGALLGMVVGCGWVLVAAAFRNPAAIEPT